MAETAELAGKREAVSWREQIVAIEDLNTTVLLASTGFCGRELYAIQDRANHLYMVGSMGCVLPLALGLALARPDLRVIALDGDGAALMRRFVTGGRSPRRPLARRSARRRPCTRSRTSMSRSRPS